MYFYRKPVLTANLLKPRLKAKPERFKTIGVHQCRCAHGHHTQATQTSQHAELCPGPVPRNTRTCRGDADASAVVRQQLGHVDDQSLARSVAVELGAAGEDADQRAGGDAAAGAARQQQLIQAHQPVRLDDLRLREGPKGLQVC